MQFLTLLMGIFVFIFGSCGLHRRFRYRQRIRVYNNVYNESREKILFIKKILF